ncbi:hypothetical protein T440DRAFT_484001 [Plenodomus tracheiphilus IPT5]|uniref:Uncharacterized protein n=1 Tax=Plenodomus tracheiphilus IPT5 TaxID=1408161 RepID=A0A6A7APP2_9PLEO|nr:hypothetical protein T440DRAFT_484001 [Plenodomus tracheiphilus IPT5]
MFLPVVCTYSDATSAKIYPVEDVEKGIKPLRSPDLKYTVTNGDVADCTFLPLTWGADTNATEPGWPFYDKIDFLSDVTALEEHIEFDDTAFKDGAWIDIEDEDPEVWFEEVAGLMFNE